jgi:hypothetical protein
MCLTIDNKMRKYKILISFIDRKRLIIIVGLLAFIMLSSSIGLSPKGVFADQPTNLLISPILNYPTVLPGKSVNIDLTVINKDTNPVALEAYAQNFAASNEVGAITFNTESDPHYSAASWITIEPDNLVLGPGQMQKVRVNISVPKVAEAGDHYGVVFFEPLNEQNPDYTNSFGITGRVGALFMIDSGGPIYEQGTVLGEKNGEKCVGATCSFQTESFRQWGPVPFSFKFGNTGNIHVNVSGKIDIYNIFGSNVGEVTVNPETVLAKSTRYFTATWLREPLFGWYRAKLTLTYGSLGVKDTAYVDFFGFPWETALVILIIALIVGLFLKFGRGKRSKANKNGMQDKNNGINMEKRA